MKKLNYLSIQVNPFITKIFNLADQVDRQINVERNHPDFVLTDNKNSRVFIVEVSCLFDPFTGQCYTHKRDLYEPLRAEYEANGYDANVIVFIVGSLGSVHKKFVDGLVKLGFPKSQGKEIAKYCSVSSAIGSKIIWNIRCRRKHMAHPH